MLLVGKNFTRLRTFWAVSGVQGSLALKPLLGVDYSFTADSSHPEAKHHHGLD